MITDLRLGGEDGMSLIDKALKMEHPPICIMMTACGSARHGCGGDEAWCVRLRHQAHQYR